MNGFGSSKWMHGTPTGSGATDSSQRGWWESRQRLPAPISDNNPNLNNFENSPHRFVGNAAVSAATATATAQVSTFPWPSGGAAGVPTSASFGSLKASQQYRQPNRLNDHAQSPIHAQVHVQAPQYPVMVPAQLTVPHRFDQTFAAATAAQNSAAAAAAAAPPHRPPPPPPPASSHGSLTATPAQTRKRSAKGLPITVQAYNPRRGDDQTSTQTNAQRKSTSQTHAHGELSSHSHPAARPPASQNNHSQKKHRNRRRRRSQSAVGHSNSKSPAQERDHTPQHAGHSIKPAKADRSQEQICSVDSFPSGGADSVVPPIPVDSATNVADKTHSADIDANEENNNALAKKSASLKKLELLRAKLDQAKKRKLAMEDELKQEAPTKSSGEMQEALERARAKLRGALISRDRARQTMGPTLKPISALSTSLIITNIQSSGPEELVYYPNPSFDIDRAREKLEDIIAQSPMEDNSKTLANRKLRLQKELLALKEKLEMNQRDAMMDTKSSAGNDTKRSSNSNNPKQALSKEGLERRKEEAQAFMDISYWKHFVSKQEHMLSEVNSQVYETLKALKDCTHELEETDRALCEADSNIEELELRQNSVDKLICDATARLLNKRKELHCCQTDLHASDRPAAS